MEEAIITIVFILISFTAWIVNLVNEKNKKAKRDLRPQRGQRPRPRREGGEFQSEIDQFLGAVRRGNNEEEEEELLIEVVPDDEIRSQEQPVALSTSFSSIEDRTIGSRHLGIGIGSGIEDHVEEYMDSHVKEYMHSMDSAPGEFVLDDDQPLTSLKSTYQSKTLSRSRKSLKTGRIASMLKNPLTVRNAIIIGEVLAPCRSLKSNRR